MSVQEGDGVRRVAPHRFETDSTAGTIRLGTLLGGLLQEGDVLVLTGDLGAGKTQLTKGIAQAMGITADVTSPTFTIEMIYEGSSFPLHHFDLYRLDDADQLEDTGLYDVLGTDGVCVIEWGEQFAAEIGDERLDVFVTRLDNRAAPGAEPPRLIELKAHDERGRALLADLDATVDALKEDD